MSDKTNFIGRIVIGSIIIICLILIGIFSTGCNLLKGANDLNEGAGKAKEALKNLTTEDFKGLTVEELQAELVKERKLRIRAQEAHGQRLTFWQSLIFYIGGPLIIGIAIGIESYIPLIKTKPLVITGIIFTFMPQLINMAESITVSLGDWFILLVKIISGVSVIGAGLYVAWQFKKKQSLNMAKVVHYGQFATQWMNAKQKIAHNISFHEDAKKKGLHHDDDDVNLISGAKEILDKAKRVFK